MQQTKAGTVHPVRYVLHQGTGAVHHEQSVLQQTKTGTVHPGRYVLHQGTGAVHHGNQCCNKQRQEQYILGDMCCTKGLVQYTMAISVATNKDWYSQLWAISDQDSRLLYYLSGGIKTWLNINHITVHNNTYGIFYITISDDLHN